MRKVHNFLTTRYHFEETPIIIQPLFLTQQRSLRSTMVLAWRHLVLICLQITSSEQLQDFQAEGLNLEVAKFQTILTWLQTRSITKATKSSTTKDLRHASQNMNSLEQAVFKLTSNLQCRKSILSESTSILQWIWFLTL